MRKAGVLSAVLASIAMLVPCSLAGAAPQVSFSERLAPVPGFAPSGNVIGAGADLRIEYAISGSEYGGFPPPLIGLRLFLPEDLGVELGGFKTCPSSTLLELREPAMCPRGSAAGQPGSVDLVAPDGATRISEQADCCPSSASATHSRCSCRPGAPPRWTRRSAASSTAPAPGPAPGRCSKSRCR